MSGLLGAVLVVAHPWAVAALLRGEIQPVGNTIQQQFTVFDAEGNRVAMTQDRFVEHSAITPSLGYTVAPHSYRWHVQNAPPHGRLLWTPSDARLTERNNVSLYTIAYGWPLVSFASDYALDDAKRDFLLDSRTGLSIPGSLQIFTFFGGFERALPIRPIPLGILANWAVATPLAYLALTLLGFHLARPSAKRLRTGANGVCPFCGYDVEDLDHCPECGNSGERT